MTAYAGDYQGLHGKPSFYLSWCHYLWGNDFNSAIGNNPMRYPSLALGSLFKDYANMDSQTQTAATYSMLDFNPMGVTTLTPIMNTDSGGWWGNNTIQVRLAGSEQNNIYKMNDSSMLFDHVIILNHNMHTMDYKFQLDVGSGHTDNTYDWQNYSTSVVHNGTKTGNYCFPDFDGMTIMKITDTPNWGTESHPTIRFRFDPAPGSDGEYGGDLKIGSIIFAKKYEMETTPIKNYSMQYINSATKKSSINGIGYTNTMSPYSTMRATRATIHGGQQNAFRGRIQTGYRKWNMAFNVLTNDETDHGMFPVNEAANTQPINDQNYMDGTSDIYPDLSSGIDLDHQSTWRNNDFTSRVWTYTNGFNDPFIFHQSKINDPDQYAVAMIDQNKFKSSQVGNNIFNLKMSITEML